LKSAIITPITLDAGRRNWGRRNYARRHDARFCFSRRQPKLPLCFRARANEKGRRTNPCRTRSLAWRRLRTLAPASEIGAVRPVTCSSLHGNQKCRISISNSRGSGARGRELSTDPLVSQRRRGFARRNEFHHELFSGHQLARAPPP
jgi:hypothetical protein